MQHHETTEVSRCLNVSHIIIGIIIRRDSKVFSILQAAVTKQTVSSFVQSGNAAAVNGE